MEKTRTGVFQVTKGICGIILGLLTCVCILALLWSSSEPAVAAAPPSNLQVVSLGGGAIVILNQDKGSVAFCTGDIEAGLPPTPMGQCAHIGSVGTSASGFIITPSGFD